jgi:dTDP-4-amino-4,6-dideoxygalactose transaminase
MLAPYLRRIDEARWYSNFGPLVREFEASLAARFEAKTHIVTVTNATLGLAMALRVRAPEPGLCLIPAWTFVATAHAVKLAGHTPFLADVDAQSGALTPEIARAALKDGPLRAVIPVAPHGQPLDVRAWAAFEAETGVPVILDAAAGFDSATDASAPLVVSLHATKALGVGEGGFFATQDAALAEAVRAQSVFGFSGSRDSAVAAMNAKMSEYAAAVGLAALDHWPQTRSRYQRAARMMRTTFTRDAPLSFQAGWGAEWISAACAVQFRGADADRVARALANEGIETRRWWERGVHRQPAFRATPKAGALNVTDQLAASTLGLPFSVDLNAEDIARIADAVKRA